MKERDLISNCGALMGRLLIGTVYIASGIGLVGSFHGVTAMMTGRGIPLPMLALCLTIAVWLVGGICVILGWQFRPAASVLLVVSVPVVVGIHWPWSAGMKAFPDELNHFMQGLAMLGGLAYLAAFGPGRFYIGRTRRIAQFDVMEAR
ncbi:DoxX family protein [Cupriavidus sp. DF5525]|uniref:DoxX family protein n=1 Tax=Cupriavidus sp. DF5525 TaxID=3160989 RepID=UPI0032DF92B1